MKLIRNHKVTASMTDSLANLSVIGIFRIVEDTIAELMGELQYDDITMKERYGAVWVSSKIRIRFLKRMAWNESFYTAGFISSMTGGTINVDVALRNMADELCAYGRVEYCALEIKTGRLIKIASLGIGSIVTAEQPETDLAFIRFQNVELPESGRVQVKYTGIDFARHTNNIEYIRFMLNTYSVQELETRPIKELEILFKNQTFENDVLTIHKGSFGETDVFLLKKEDKVVVRSEILF
ncbi:MAG: hypothetical protein HFH84_07885 [Lachnospiraceae bacterium]|nr:hypothetical protein [Lachnospiraceae bacterium]